MATPDKAGGAAGANVPPPPVQRPKAAKETPVALPRHIHPSRRPAGEA
jgi:hypothetical protein